MGVIGFVAAGGGSIGVLAEGVLTDILDWHADLPRQHPRRRSRDPALSAMLVPATAASAAGRTSTSPGRCS